MKEIAAQKRARAWRLFVVATVTAALACEQESQAVTLIQPSPAPAKRMSEAGLDRIRMHEEFVATVYDDGAGNETIGYGHLVLEEEDYSGGITEAQANELFAKDVERVVNPSLDKIEVDLMQHQIDALGSFIYNVGPRAFERFVLDYINSGRAKDATDKMGRFVTGRDQGTGERVTLRGLIERRRDEIALFHGQRLPVRLRKRAIRLDDRTLDYPA